MFTKEILTFPVQHALVNIKKYVSLSHFNLLRFNS